MKITETVERECCQPQDLLLYGAGYPRSHPLPDGLLFCKHCGGWWVRLHPPSEKAPRLVPVVVVGWEVG